MHATTEVDVREPHGLPRFHVALFTILAAYAAFRAASFYIALGGGRGGAVPSVIEDAVSLQVWAGLWTAGAVLHLAATRWKWARVATLWSFSIKGLAVAVAFVMSTGSIGGLVSYGFPVVALWLIQWALTMRTTVVVQAVPVIEAHTVAEAARERLTAETGEIPEVPYG